MFDVDMVDVQSTKWKYTDGIRGLGYEKGYDY